MRGSVRKKGNRWQLRVYVGRVAGRQRYRSRSVSAGSRREAERELRAFVVECEAVDDPDDLDVTVAELFARWWPRHSLDLAPSTKQTHEGDYRRHILPHLGERRVIELRGRHLDAWHGELLAEGLKANYVADLHRRLSPLLTQAVKWELIAANPCAQATPPRKTKPVQVAPTADEVMAIVRAARALGDEELAVYVLVAANLGARRGEMVALRWDDVDFDEGRIVIQRGATRGDGGLHVRGTKTGAIAGGAISSEAVSVLRSWRAVVDERACRLGISVAAEAYVFSPEFDGSAPWYPDSFTRRFRLARVEADIRPEISVNKLRHFVGTSLIAAGVDPRTVATRLGHANPSMTLSVYAASVPARDREAAEILGGLISDDDVSPPDEPQQLRLVPDDPAVDGHPGAA